jgi:hypothetical protein
VVGSLFAAIFIINLVIWIVVGIPVPAGSAEGFEWRAAAA